MLKIILDTREFSSLLSNAGEKIPENITWSKDLIPRKSYYFSTRRCGSIKRKLTFEEVVSKKNKILGFEQITREFKKLGSEYYYYFFFSKQLSHMKNCQSQKNFLFEEKIAKLAKRLQNVISQSYNDWLRIMYKGKRKFKF